MSFTNFRCQISGTTVNLEPHSCRYQDTTIKIGQEALIKTKKVVLKCAQVGNSTSMTLEASKCFRGGQKIDIGQTVADNRFAYTCYKNPSGGVVLNRTGCVDETKSDKSNMVALNYQILK